MAYKSILRYRHINPSQHLKETISVLHLLKIVRWKRITQPDQNGLMDRTNHLNARELLNKC